MNQNRLKLDEEERSILWDFERGEFESIKNFRAEKQRLKAAASQTLQKASVSIFAYQPEIWKKLKSGPSPKGYRTRLSLPAPYTSL